MDNLGNIVGGGSMNTQKLKTLTNHLETIKNKLSDSQVPEKHKGRVEQYKAFLKRELWLAERSIAQLKGI